MVLVVNVAAGFTSPIKKDRLERSQKTGVGPRDLPRGSQVVPFWAVYYTPYKQKIGHNQKGATLEPSGSQNHLVIGSFEVILRIPSGSKYQSNKDAGFHGFDQDLLICDWDPLG